MNFSYNWLAELVEGLDVTPARLGQMITIKTAECDGVHPSAAWLGRVCTARVIDVAPIPGSSNVKALVETGRYGTVTVVCGAPNCRPGLVTAYVPPATVLGGGREIGKSQVSGVESEGMLASGAELGLNRDEAKILELDQEPGLSIAGCLPDAIVEIDNKSLTHRPDLWGHHGMAREVAAISGKKLRDPVKLGLLPAGDPAIRVVIEDYGLCPRYSALVFDNVRVEPSPLWLEYRLESIGLNPIGNIVDVTNFIMAEIAQPMHAFDADKLRGGTIRVRCAREGESLVALNGETYTLGPANLVIADEAGPIALAGVIGGLDSAISPATRRIVLESACFHAGSIRKTSTRLKLRTDASMRFEKSQDPVNTTRGLARAIELLRLVSRGITPVGGVADARRDPAPPAAIELPLDWLARKLGTEVPKLEVMHILESLEFGISEPCPGTLAVTVPSWRATKDISIKEDLVEEIGRMIGYDSIPPRAPLMPALVPPSNDERKFHHGVRDMVAAQGFTEVYNYSFVNEDLIRPFGFDPLLHVAVRNPISADQSLLRVSLLPRIRQNILDNARHFDSFRLFELGHEIHRRSGELPEEAPKLCAVIYAKDGDGSDGLFEIKRLAECLMPGCVARPTAPRSYEHPARAVQVEWRGGTLGRIFELHPRLIETGRAAVLDVSLGLMEILAQREIQYRAIRRFPSSSFDLSVIANQRDLAGTIQELLMRYAGETLESIQYVREYSGPPLPERAKSVSYRLTLAASDRTLSSDEVGAVRNRIIAGMRDQGYELRV